MITKFLMVLKLIFTYPYMGYGFVRGDDCRCELYGYDGYTECLACRGKREEAERRSQERSFFRELMAIFNNQQQRSSDV